MASSLFTITRNVASTNTINSTAKEFFGDIDDRISIEQLTFDRGVEETIISLNLKAPQEILDQLTYDQQEILTNTLVEKLQRNVSLDMTIIPVTSVKKHTMHIMSPKEQIEKTTQSFLTTLYHDKVYLLHLAYYSKKDNIVVANFYTDSAEIKKSVFSTQYEKHIQTEHPNISKVIINREKTDNEAIPLTAYQETLDDLSASFRSFFPESVLHKLEFNETTETIDIILEASTPLSSEIFKQHIGERHYHLSELYGKNVSGNTYVSWLEKVE